MVHQIYNVDRETAWEIVTQSSIYTAIQLELDEDVLCMETYKTTRTKPDADDDMRVAYTVGTVQGELEALHISIQKRLWDIAVSAYQIHNLFDAAEEIGFNLDELRTGTLDEQALIDDIYNLTR